MNINNISEKEYHPAGQMMKKNKYNGEWKVILQEDWGTPG